MKCFVYVFRKGAKVDERIELHRREISPALSIKDKVRLMRNSLKYHNGDGAGIEHIHTLC